MKTWIKLYTEVLHDPKMGRLTDRQYRTCINLFLLAGQIDQDGALPQLDDIAYHLRTDTASLSADAMALAAVGILTQEGDDWTVTRFAERQARNQSETPEQVKRRVTEYRQRKAQACNGDVTACNVSVTACNDIEEKREEKKREEGEREDVTPHVTADVTAQPAQPTPIEHDTVDPRDTKRHKLHVLPLGPEPSPAVKAYLHTCNQFAKPQYATEPVRTLIDGAVQAEHVPRWEKVITDWLLAGYKAENVAGMVDVFTNGYQKGGQNGGRDKTGRRGTNDVIKSPSAYRADA